jgi:hypothetical protein
MVERGVDDGDLNVEMGIGKKGELVGLLIYQER